MQTTGDSGLERTSSVDGTAAAVKPEPAVPAKSRVVVPSEPRDPSDAPTQRIRAQPGVSAARTPSATVLLDVRNGLYHTLNDAAGRIWDVIEAGDAMATMLVDVLHVEFDDVPRATIARDVKRLLDAFVEAELITVEPVQ